ncbi:MAG: hypothetical protein KIT56_06820, partial [Gammaproteobacteria bacterium]|nr:hypothetical protein [Gammaproteobacteria bacterium]
LKEEVTKFMNLYNWKDARLQSRHCGFYSDKNQLLDDRFQILEHSEVLSDNFNKVGTNFTNIGNFDQGLQSFSYAISALSLVIRSGVPINKEERTEMLLNTAMIRLSLIDAHLKNSEDIGNLQEEKIKIIHINIVKTEKILSDKGIREHIIYDEKKKEFYNRIQNKLEETLTNLEKFISDIISVNSIPITKKII